MTKRQSPVGRAELPWGVCQGAVLVGVVCYVPVRELVGIQRQEVLYTSSRRVVTYLPL
jgi:hypothetical protein